MATDAPDLGGVEPKRALMTYWALGSHEMVGVEFLQDVGKVPRNSYFLFVRSRSATATADPVGRLFCISHWSLVICHYLVINLTVRK